MQAGKLGVAMIAAGVLAASTAGVRAQSQPTTPPSPYDSASPQGQGLPAHAPSVASDPYSPLTGGGTDQTAPATPADVAPPPNVPPVTPTSDSDSENASAGSTSDRIVANDAADLPFYAPRDPEKRLPWNSHDMWDQWGGQHFGVTVELGVYGFFVGPVSGPAGQLSLKLRLASMFGIEAGVLNPGSNLVLGAILGGGGGWILVDAGLPDLSFGVLHPSLAARSAGHLGGTAAALSAEAGVFGLRFAYEDFVVFEVRPGISVWGVTAPGGTVGVSANVWFSGGIVF